jgi:hypothetical protein
MSCSNIGKYRQEIKKPDLLRDPVLDNTHMRSETQGSIRVRWLISHE